ncbi:MAG: hypothetical protein R2724_03685 [Bryobacterales bacterium]
MEQLDVDVEAHQEGQVLVDTQNFVEEGVAGRTLDLDHALLADAGIDEQADGERQIGLPAEILDLLRLAVLEDLEVVLGEAIDEQALLVPNGRKDVHDLNVDGDDGLGQFLGWIRLLGEGAGGKRGGRGGQPLSAV